MVLCCACSTTHHSVPSRLASYVIFPSHGPDFISLPQTLFNLCGNSAKFTKFGQIELSASMDADDAKGDSARCFVTVKGTGCGIPKEKLERIFDFGAQANSADATKGTGIGLSFVSEVRESRVMFSGPAWIMILMRVVPSLISFATRYARLSTEHSPRSPARRARARRSLSPPSSLGVQWHVIREILRSY